MAVCPIALHTEYAKILVITAGLAIHQAYLRTCQRSVSHARKAIRGLRPRHEQREGEAAHPERSSPVTAEARSAYSPMYRLVHSMRSYGLAVIPANVAFLFRRSCTVPHNSRQPVAFAGELQEVVVGSQWSRLRQLMVLQINAQPHSEIPSWALARPLTLLR